MSAASVAVIYAVPRKTARAILQFLRFFFGRFLQSPGIRAFCQMWKITLIGVPGGGRGRRLPSPVRGSRFRSSVTNLSVALTDLRCPVFFRRIHTSRMGNSEAAPTTRRMSETGARPGKGRGDGRRESAASAIVTCGSRSRSPCSSVTNLSATLADLRCRVFLFGASRYESNGKFRSGTHESSHESEKIRAGTGHGRGIDQPNDRRTALAVENRSVRRRIFHVVPVSEVEKVPLHGLRLAAFHLVHIPANDPVENVTSRQSREIPGIPGGSAAPAGGDPKGL